jgi:hypothetical protein
MRSQQVQLLRASSRALFQHAGSRSVSRQYGTISEIPTQLNATPPSVFQNALDASAPRTNWTREEIKEIYETPLMQLAFAAVSVRIVDSYWDSSNQVLFLGHCSPKIPQPLLDSDVYSHEHQNRRMQRKLLLLRPKLAIQDWSQSYPNGYSRLGPRCCSNCEE